jgi:hypothetical protein
MGKRLGISWEKHVLQIVSILRAMRLLLALSTLTIAHTFTFRAPNVRQNVFVAPRTSM